MDDRSGLWTGLGWAAVILALTFGVGSCIRMGNESQAKIVAAQHGAP